LAPRALRQRAPSAPWGVVVRPLNFTVGVMLHQQASLLASGASGSQHRSNALSLISLFLSRGTVTAFIASLWGCGVGCLYGEQSKVTVAAGRADVSAQRLVEVVDNALRPMGFSGNPARTLTPQPDWYWDYEFRSAGVGTFAQRDAVEVHIRYDNLAITLSDWDRASKATAFDRRVTAAIESAVHTELNAEISFQPIKSPAFCLGP